MARNPTTRNGLVPLWGRLLVSWYFDIVLDTHEVFWHQAYTRTITEYRHLSFISYENLENYENSLREMRDTYI